MDWRRGWSEGMLTDKERAKLKALEIWQYPKSPGGFRRVVLLLRQAAARISREVLVDAAKALEFDADDRFTVDFRGVQSEDDLADLAEARQTLEEALPGRVRVRVTLGRGAMGVVPLLRDCQCCVDFGKSAPPENLMHKDGFCEAFFRITPTNQPEAPAWIGPLFRAGYNPVVAEVDHSLNWTESDMARLESTLIRLEGVSSFFHDAGLRLLDREWVCRGSDTAHCGVGRETIAIAPDGLQYPCPRFVGYDPTRAIGHVSDSLWIEMWQRYGGYHPLQNRECGGYPVEHKCLAGCAYLNVKNNGELRNGVGTQCRERRLRTEFQALV